MMQNIHLSMELYIVFLLLTTGATIEILVDQKTIECGRKLTLTCKLQANTSMVAWMYENNVIPIATCVEDTCSSNPNYVNKIKFLYDVNQGIFNLTILKLAVNNIGEKYVCTNGFDSASEIISYIDDKALLVEEKAKNEITATSGCISPDENVRIKWIKIYASNKREREFFPNNLQSNINKCSKGSFCDNDQLVQRSEVISAEQSDSGNYFLKITVVYGNENIESQITLSRYNLEEKDFNDVEDSDDLKINEIFMIVLFWLLVIIVIAVYAVTFYRSRYTSSNQSIHNLAENRFRSERTFLADEGTTFIGSSEA